MWPASFVVARAYVDQLARSGGLASARVSVVRADLARAEQISGAARQEALTRLAAQLTEEAATAGDPAKVRTLAAAVTDLANAGR
ncbi:MAG TPA: hypothetical protein VJ816_04280 [Gemmatimonadales bacterium]|nr:hypothetical protein [Gemmatimonadales bacterium]